MKPTMPTAGPELYRAALAADDAWSAELHAAFGKNAGDRRYDVIQTAHPESCRRACEAWRAATDAWLAFMRSEYLVHLKRSRPCATPTT